MQRSPPSAMFISPDILTPTTLRHIEQELGIGTVTGMENSDMTSHDPPTSITILTRNWQGGEMEEATRDDNAPTPEKKQRKPSVGRKPGGGRRPRKDSSLSPEEEERRRVRRERNKLAAARCRKRRVDQTNLLVEETEGLELKKKNLQEEINKLNVQVEELEFILEAHEPNCRRSNNIIKRKVPKRPDSLQVHNDNCQELGASLVTPGITPSTDLFDWSDLQTPTGLTPLITPSTAKDILGNLTPEKLHIL